MSVCRSPAARKPIVFIELNGSLMLSGDAPSRIHSVRNSRPSVMKYVTMYL